VRISGSEYFQISGALVSRSRMSALKAFTSGAIASSEKTSASGQFGPPGIAIGSSCHANDEIG
jgi:hypothetical protein